MNAQNIAQTSDRKQSLRSKPADREVEQLAFSFTVIEAGLGCASPAKTFGCDAQGMPVIVQSGCQPSSGAARRVTFAGSPTDILEQVAATFEAMPSSSAVICAPPPAERDAWPFTTKAALPNTPGAITRSDDYFSDLGGPALFGLDLDVKGWPEQLQAKVRETQGLVTGVFEHVAPCFNGCAMLRRASSSSGIRNVVTGQTFKGESQHRFFVAKDARSRARFSRILHERLVLAGYGYGFVSKAGAIDVRSLIDIAASASASRLWFEGAAVLADARLQFVPGGRQAIVTRGGLLDMDSLLDLTPQERLELVRIESEIRAQCADEARARRSEWLAERKAELVAKGMSPERAEKQLGMAVERHVLEDDFRVEFDDGTSATVLEIMESPKAFHKQTGPDPLEPDYGGGRNKAILYTDGPHPKIVSLAHGGIEYVLRESQDAIANRWWESPPVLIEVAGPADIFGHADPAELGDLPPGCLPAWLASWVGSEARRKGTPEAFATASAVAVLGAAVGNSLRLQVREHDNSWSEPAALWVCLVAPPGSTKSPVIAAATNPLDKLNTELLNQWRPKHEAWRKAETAARRRKADGPDPGPEPRCGRRTADNFTVEKLIHILSQNPRGVLCAPDELSGLLGQLGAYKRSGEGDRGQFLGLFDGREVTVDRVGAGTLAAESALISVLAGSQPDKMRELAKNMSGDGLLQRFMFLMHDGRRRRGLDEPPDSTAVATYKRVVRGLASADYVFPNPLRTEPGGAAALADAVEHIAQLQYGVGASPALQGHLSKWGRILPRLVLVLHAAIAFESQGQVDPDDQIPLSTVEMAINLARFLVRHSLAFYGEFFGTPERASEARWIAEFLLTRPELTEVSRRDLYDARKDFRGDGVGKLFVAAGELENAGWLEVSERKADGPARWRVDQRIHSRFAQHAERARRERAERRELIQESVRVRDWIGGRTRSISEPDVGSLSLLN